ncbi:PREDICTED: uncharacterized protein LOC109184573 [Ipomoea nil]|uniref:uncharacterized protein LOC109184573 n=1 Tax=Ipomoea nil TaxID=35883 RepID=UPI000900FF2E|nr:PREDICTED: uncharacterized protein LOC109184573 [Ipomoea nil]
MQYLDKKCWGLNVVVKLDMMKAFDRVSWPFLQAVLFKLGFPAMFVNVVMRNLEATKLSVLVNGVSCGFFQPTRGVKQGDPLSPLLFILASEALSRSLILKMGVGSLSPYATHLDCPVITHLAFADDIVIFVNGSSASLKALADVLDLYQQGSGQKINFHKSFFVTSRRCPTARGSNMSRILGMQQSSLPFRYLGVSLFKGRNRPLYYQHLFEKVDTRLQSWQRKLLSPGGQLILIRHILSSIPLFTIASVLLPRQTERSLETKFANFFWGVDNGKPKQHWASWRKLCYPEDEGGLGIRSIDTIQKAASAKLLFNLLRGGSLWCDFLESLYLNRPSLAPSLTWKRMQQAHDFVDINVVYKGDLVVWSLAPYGDFTTASAYEALRPKAGRSLSARCIWGDGVPSEISIFMWRLLRQFLPFPDVIQNFGVCLPSICPLCSNASADLSHCLLACPVAQQVWRHFRNLFGLGNPTADSIRVECHSWWLFAVSGSATAWCANLIPSLALWTLWCSYNQGLHDGRAPPAVEIVRRVKRDLLAISTTRKLK